MSERSEPNSFQEQGVAAWISHQNLLRHTKLVNQLAEIQSALIEAQRGQKVNLTKALRSLDLTKDNIQALIDSNRGGQKGLHGFIAEPAQVGIGNARKLVLGEKAIYKWINDNGTWDLCKVDLATGQSASLQLKFNINIENTIEAIRDFLGKHSADIQNTDRILIPKDRFQELQRLLNMSEQEANRLPTQTGTFSRRVWTLVQDFFREHPDMRDMISPSDLDYAAVQKGKILETLAKEEQDIKSTSKQIEDKNQAAAKEEERVAYMESRPTWQEAAKFTAISAVLESTTNFLTTYIRIRQKKKLDEFTTEDWKTLGLKTGKGAVSGTIRGAAVYSLTNFTAVPASLASGLVTAVLSVAELGHSYQTGSIDKAEFLSLTEAACMDAAVSSLSALVGEVLIPIPILGALIGTAAGKLASEIAKNYCGESEQYTIIGCQRDFEQSCLRFGEEYSELISRLDAKLSRFRSMTAMLLDENENLAFCQSVALADSVGVEPEKVLRTKNDIDDYFEK